MQQQLTKWRGAWGGVPVRAQVAIAGVALVTLLIMFLVLRAATGTSWVPVASNLPADKLGQAQTVLEEAGIQNRVNPTSTAIEVPAGQEPKAASVLIPAGIAAKGGRVGCAKQSEQGQSLMAQTSAQTKLMLETCRENDAANTIEGIQGVNKASVDVTLPDKSLFASEEQPTKASVMVDTGGEGLPAPSIRGIQSYIANSFDGLKAANVVITDETGTIVGGDGAADAAAGGMEKLQTEAKMNQKITNDLTTTLERIVGKGNVVVTSNVDLDMDKITRNVIDNKPAGQDGQPLVEVEDYAKELLKGQGTTGTEGVAGTGSNQGTSTTDTRTATPDTTGSGTDPNSNYLSDQAKVTYANNKVAEVIEVAKGSVIRSRIGVVVDDNVDAAAATAVKDAVQTWMGGNAQDSFSFAQAPISSATATKSTTSSASPAIAGYVKWALLGLGMIGLAFVLRRSLTQRTAELLAPADDLLLLERGDFTPIPIAELEAALAAHQPSAERRTRLEMQRKVETIAESKPHDVANELRRWMLQDDLGYAPIRKVG